MVENIEAFAGLEPQTLWKHFEAITRIARPPGREGKITEYVRNWAKAVGFETVADACGNICVRVPGNGDYQGAAPVVLQGHLDMVCEREADSPYDPEKGNIHVVRDGEWLVARGTTLGADNGIGVAMMLHAAEARDVARGPLDLLFTVQEETGLIGAARLDPTLLRGRTLINLDSEEEGALSVGCAGGSVTRLTWTAPREPATAGSVQRVVSLSGLRGGHSGMDIHRQRLNAIRAISHLLRQAAADGVPLRLRSIRGGDKTNAIPRECEAGISLTGADDEKFQASLHRTLAAMAEQYRGHDDGLQMSVRPAEEGLTETFSPKDTVRLLDLLCALPTGVLAMSAEIASLVETSSNLAVLRQAGATLTIDISSRSSSAPALAAVASSLHAQARLAGVAAQTTEGYPEWQPDLSSHVLAVTRRAYQRLFGRDPALTVVHAGLECGLIGKKIPGMDMISFGPRIEGVHAPGEKVHIPSVARCWRLLGTVLEDLARHPVACPVATTTSKR